MSKSARPTIDELLEDQLVQAVMRADRVEPGELRTMLVCAAGRIAATRPPEPEAQPRRLALSSRPRRPVAERCGAALCGC